MKKLLMSASLLVGMFLIYSCSDPIGDNVSFEESVLNMNKGELGKELYFYEKVSDVFWENDDAKKRAYQVYDRYQELASREGIPSIEDWCTGCWGCEGATGCTTEEGGPGPPPGYCDDCEVADPDN